MFIYLLVPVEAVVALDARDPQPIAPVERVAAHSLRGGVFRDAFHLLMDSRSRQYETVMPKPSLVRLALSTPMNPSCSLASATMSAAMAP